jgi:hypothetical protein
VKRMIIATLMLAGTLGGFAPFALMPHAAAQVGDQGVMPVGPSVLGVVTGKFTPEKDGTYEIAVNDVPYEVPQEFYDLVEVGTVVQFDGTNWTVLGGT